MTRKQFLSIVFYLWIFPFYGCNQTIEESPHDAAEQPDSTLTITPPNDCAAGNSNEEIFPGHPYYHQVFRATSDDGLNFQVNTNLLLDHASVPEVAIADGKMKIYFVNGEVGSHGIWVAEENENGSFEKTGCVHINDMFRGNAVDPNLVVQKDGSSRLFYFGSIDLGPTMGSPTGRPISSAISEDGFHFRDQGVNILVSQGTDPTVIVLPNNTWLMGIDSGTTKFAVSEDGINFQENGVEVAISGGPDLTLLSDGRIRLYGRIGGGIGSFISQDNGQSWRSETGYRLEDPPGKIVADPSVVENSRGEWVMIYKLQSL